MPVTKKFTQKDKADQEAAIQVLEVLGNKHRELMDDVVREIYKAGIMQETATSSGRAKDLAVLMTTKNLQMKKILNEIE